MKGDTMPLRDAGYRERVFCKAKLAQMGMMDRWPAALNWPYDSHRDEVKGWEVAHEGTKSKEILASFGLDDADCFAKEG